MAELVDARDLKSLGRKAVPVRFRSRAPEIKGFRLIAENPFHLYSFSLPTFSPLSGHKKTARYSSSGLESVWLVQVVVKEPILIRKGLDVRMVSGMLLLSRGYGFYRNPFSL